MPDSTLIALAGLATTALSPVAVGYVQRKSDRLRFRHERAARDLDERRELLDAAAHALTTLIDATRKAMGGVAQTTPRDLEAFNAMVEATHASRQECHGVSRRMMIRLGRQSAVVTAFAAVLERCDAATQSTVNLVSAEASGQPPTPMLAVLSADKPIIDSQEEAYDAFLDAATALVGDADPAGGSAKL